jgi:hypothetical protein
MMDAMRTYETSVYSNETTRRYIPEGYHLHARRRENLNFTAPPLYELFTGFYDDDQIKKDGLCGDETRMGKIRKASKFLS